MFQNESITVIGAGTMGHSIALNFAWKGFPVTMVGQDDTDLGKGQSGIRSKLALMAQEHLILPEEQEEILNRINLTTSLQDAATSATFIIEAAPEILDLKHKLFQHLETLCSPETIFASNTSALAPSEISKPLQHPQRFLVTHFWNPAHLIPLVEVVPSPNTSDQTIDKTFQLLNALGKKAILVKKEIPGFIANRLQFALLREALHLLENGVASKEDIDAAVTYSIGRRLPITGPLLSADMGGLDVFNNISSYLFPLLSNTDKPGQLLDQLVANGSLGQKSDKGFYDWKEDLQNVNASREKLLIDFLKRDID